MGPLFGRSSHFKCYGVNIGTDDAFLGWPEMSRYKGRATIKTPAREFPYAVETAVPEGGLGRTIDRMYEFHALRGIKAQAGAWPSHR
jgi:hypothetical protein